MAKYLSTIIHPRIGIFYYRAMGLARVAVSVTFALCEKSPMTESLTMSRILHRVMVANSTTLELVSGIYYTT